MTAQESLFDRAPRPAAAPRRRRRAAGRAPAPAHARRGDRPAAPARRRASRCASPSSPASLHSMILWGPPGRRQDHARAADGQHGRRAVHRAVGGAVGRQGHPRGGRARAGRAHAPGARTIVFVDEVHRFNKAQQDAFLPHVESGLFTFIGATTENPSFEVNSALLSRATVHVLQAARARRPGRAAARARKALLQRRALDRRGARPPDRLCRRRRAPPAQRLREPGRDGRRARRSYDEALLERTLGEQLRRYDKGGEQFYDTISALHKSVRGSDPDASLYWLARMLDGGVDPRYVARRAGAHGQRGHRPGRPARAAPRARRGRGLRAPGQRPRASWRWRRRWSTWRSRPSPTPSTRPGTRCAHSCARTARGRCRCTCAMRRRKLMKQLGYGQGYRYAHDEAGGFAAGETLLARRHAAAALLRAGGARPGACASPSTWPSCARSTTRPPRSLRCASEPTGAPAMAALAAKRESRALAPKRCTPTIAPVSCGTAACRARRRRRQQESRRWTSFCSRSSTVWCWAACMRWSHWATRWCTASST